MKHFLTVVNRFRVFLFVAIFTGSLVISPLAAQESHSTTDIKLTTTKTGHSENEHIKPFTFENSENSFYFLFSKNIVIAEIGEDTFGYYIRCAEKKEDGTYVFELTNEVEETVLYVDLELQLLKFEVKQGFLFFAEFKE